jgi:hypothetical protein
LTLLIWILTLLLQVLTLLLRGLTLLLWGLGLLSLLLWRLLLLQKRSLLLLQLLFLLLLLLLVPPIEPAVNLLRDLIQVAESAKVGGEQEEREENNEHEVPHVVPGRVRGMRPPVRGSKVNLAELHGGLHPRGLTRLHLKGPSMLQLGSSFECRESACSQTQEVGTSVQSPGA